MYGRNTISSIESCTKNGMSFRQYHTLERFQKGSKMKQNSLSEWLWERLAHTQACKVVHPCRSLVYILCPTLLIPCHSHHWCNLSLGDLYSALDTDNWMYIDIHTNRLRRLRAHSARA
jgi:hypothetical protein